MKPDSLPPRGGGLGVEGQSPQMSSFRRKRDSIHGGGGEFGELLAHQLLLLLDIFLGNVAGRDERVDPGFGHITGYGGSA